MIFISYKSLWSITLAVFMSPRLAEDTWSSSQKAVNINMSLTTYVSHCPYYSEPAHSSLSNLNYSLLVIYTTL